MPLLAAEFGPASRNYPILFADGEVATPTALLGLEENNLFVDHEGDWAPGTHVPAYARRYPFGSVNLAGEEKFALVIDTASESLVREGADGTPLFEEGKPSLLTRRAFAFCEAFRNDAVETRAFCEALQHQDLLVERHADIELPEGRKLAVAGFKIISFDAFRALEDDIVVDWHRRGWLALVQFHLASLDQFATLLQRRSALGGSVRGAADNDGHE